MLLTKDIPYDEMNLIQFLHKNEFLDAFLLLDDMFRIILFSIKIDFLLFFNLFIFLKKIKRKKELFKKIEFY